MVRILFVLKSNENINEIFNTHADIQKISVYEDEEEILFFPFSCFDIINVDNIYENGKNLTRIELSYLSRHDARLRDLKNLSKSYINDATHQATIEFSNDGIKAAAVTALGGKGAMDCGFDYKYEVPVEKIDLTFDKPFMYIIRDKSTNEAWFIGSVYEPVKYVEPDFDYE